MHIKFNVASLFYAYLFSYFSPQFIKAGRRVLKIYTDLQYLGHFGLIKIHEQQFSVEELGMSRLEKEVHMKYILISYA